MMAAFIEYLYSGDIPDLTAPAASWFFAPDVAPSNEQVAALAQALGVAGEVRELAADIGGGWAVGSVDYIEASVTVARDSLQSWWYNPGAGDSAYIGVDCALYPPGDPAGGSADATAPVCAEPTPPVNVPSADEAKAKAIAMFEAMGVAVDSYDFETYADEWSANVTGYLTLDGVRTSASISAGYGAEGMLTWASGFLATPERGADYPRIGVEAAVKRLNDQATSMYPTVRGTNVSGYAETGVAVAGEAVAGTAIAVAQESAGVAVPAPTPVEPAPGDAPTDTAATVDPPVDVAPAPGEPVCDPAADCVIEPMPIEPMIVTLTNARASLEQVWASDETVWLLPGYAFDSTDGGLYTVIAIEDQYLAYADPAPLPLPEPLPMPPETVVVEPGSSGGSSSGGGSGVDGTATVLDIKAMAALLTGLSEAEATDVASANGWTIRVVRIDGEDLAVTADYSDTRVNVAVADGVVTEVLSQG